MTPKQKTYFFILTFGLFVLLFIGSSVVIQASPLSVNIKGSTIDIKVKQVPLIDVLKAISDQGKIVLEYNDPMTEPVSLELKGITIEECVRRLLKKRNYTLTFEKTGNDSFVLVSIRITEKGSSPRVKHKPKHKPTLPSGDLAKIESKSLPPQDDLLKKYSRESFAQMFGNSNELINQLSADAIEQTPPDAIEKVLPDTIEDGLSPFHEGIRINDLSSRSAFSTIGLKEGDIVRDVNGRRIQTLQEFIEHFQTALNEESMIRIERIGENGLMNPIYIELE